MNIAHLAFSDEMLEDRHITVQEMRELLCCLPGDTNVVGFESDRFTQIQTIALHHPSFVVTEDGENPPKIKATKDRNTNKWSLDLSNIVLKKRNFPEGYTLSDLEKMAPKLGVENTKIFRAQFMAWQREKNEH